MRFLFQSETFLLHSSRVIVPFQYISLYMGSLVKFISIPSDWTRDKCDFVVHIRIPIKRGGAANYIDGILLIFFKTYYWEFDQHQICLSEFRSQITKSL